MQLPVLISAPMAGVSTPELAAAVSNAGGLGSLAVGHLSAGEARVEILKTRALTDRPFAVNVFCHRPARVRPQVERDWLEFLRPQFAEFGGQPPETLSDIYSSFGQVQDMLEVLLETSPALVSFHFGLPPAVHLEALRRNGCHLLVSVTSLEEARQAVQAGVHTLVAQGYEAGGHRGIFDEHGPDEQLSTLALTRLLVLQQSLPVVAAGGIMDGAGIAAARQLGAIAAQLGTAFLLCPEAATSYKDRVNVGDTVMTRNLSGRPARCLRNRFTELPPGPPVPDYPRTYQAGKALHAAAQKEGESGFGAHWAGQGAALARCQPAAQLTRRLLGESL